MTQSSPMDFEKEAREIAEELEQASFDHEFSLNSETKTDQALAKKRLTEARESFIAFARRAYTAGQKDMRESCALVVEAFPKEAGDRADIVNRDLRLATGIRMHPILSPDHEKVG